MSNKIAKKSAMNGLIKDEVQLTRADMMDIVIEELLSELDVEIKDLQKKQTKRTQKMQRGNTDDLAAFRALATPADANINVHDQELWYGSENCPDASRDQVVVQINYTMKKDQMPASYVQWRTEQIEESKRLADLLEKKASLESNKKRARAEIIKRGLESTEEGKKVLADIENLKVSIRSKFI